MSLSVSVPALSYLLAGAALAQQWTAVVLHPPSVTDSIVSAVNGSAQGGTCRLPEAGGIQAGLWAGSPSTWTPLTPVGTIASIGGMDDQQQCGALQLPPTHASIWSGSPQSRIDLHPDGASSSAAGPVRGSMQVGVLFLPSGDSHAALWRGTAASCVDLHPPGALQSSGSATDGVLQGGYVIWQGQTPVATIWNGTPESAVSLMPNTWSYVYGMAPGVQVGRIDVPGAIKAALWRGSAGSYADMSPPGNSTSRLLATTGTVHVGSYGQAGLSRAGINFGSPASWVSLHQFLGAPYFSFSEATSVCQSGDTVYVGGWAENSNTSYRNAILWIGTVSCYANCDGSTTAPALNVADFTCFLQRFSSGDSYANCDHSTQAPALNVADFTCFLQRFAAGCQ